MDGRDAGADRDRPDLPGGNGPAFRPRGGQSSGGYSWRRGDCQDQSLSKTRRNRRSARKSCRVSSCFGKFCRGPRHAEPLRVSWSSRMRNILLGGRSRRFAAGSFQRSALARSAAWGGVVPRYLADSWISAPGDAGELWPGVAGRYSESNVGCANIFGCGTIVDACSAATFVGSTVGRTVRAVGGLLAVVHAVDWSDVLVLVRSQLFGWTEVGGGALSSAAVCVRAVRTVRSAGELVHPLVDFMNAEGGRCADGSRNPRRHAVPAPGRG